LGAVISRSPAVGGGFFVLLFLVGGGLFLIPFRFILLDFHLRVFGQVIAAFGNNRLAGLKIDAADADPTVVFYAKLRVQRDRLAVADDNEIGFPLVRGVLVAGEADGVDRHGEHFFFADNNGSRHGLADRQAAVLVVDLDADGQVAGLRIGHAADVQHGAGRIVVRGFITFIVQRGAAGTDGHGLPGLQTFCVGDGQPDYRLKLLDIDDLAHRRADGERLPQLAVQRIQHAGNRRANGQ
jgi:hypothetical protein